MAPVGITNLLLLHIIIITSITLRVPFRSNPTRAALVAIRYLLTNQAHTHQESALGTLIPILGRIVPNLEALLRTLSWC